VKDKIRIPYKELIEAAKNAMKHSYSPYSGFRVGAALLSSRGKIYTGCNIENSSYGLTICAERTAIFKAVSGGERRFKAIAVVADAKALTPPCGACRQVIMDLAPKIDIVISNGRDTSLVLNVEDLLPFPFSKRNLHNRATRKHKK
jgi:cytidine deaminase